MKPEVHAKSSPWPTGRSIGARAGRHGRAPGGSTGAERQERRSHAERNASLCLTRRVGASAERVFQAWLDPEIAGRWLFATASRSMARADIDARVAGAFRFVERRDGELIEYRGEYLEIVPPRRIAFTFVTQEHPHVVTRVVVEITPLNEHGCSVALTHDNVPTEIAIRTKQRWIGILYGLDVTLDAQRYS